MTPEQVQAIVAYHLTREDVSQLAEEMGLNFGAGGRFGELTSEMQATLQARRASGGVNLAVSPIILDAVIEYMDGKVQ